MNKSIVKEDLTEEEINLLIGLIEVEIESLVCKDLPIEFHDIIWHKLNIMRCEKGKQRNEQSNS